MAALFTTTSTLPFHSTAFATAAGIDAWSATSKGRIRHLRSFRPHAVRTRSNSLVRRAERIREAPRRAYFLAKASPMPDEAPVIQIVVSLFMA